MNPTPTAAIVESLKKAIVDHRLEPGEKLVEQRLADTYGVSRTLVRQALYQLEKLRLIRLEPARGAFVAEPSVQEAKQVFAVRRVLENDLIRQMVAQANSKHLRALETHVVMETAALEKNDIAHRAEVLGDFHVVMAKQLDNEVLAQMLSDLISRCALITMMYQSAQDARNSNAEHAAIVEAIRERDTERALSLMNTHLDHVEASLAFPASPKNKQKQAA